MDNSVYVALSKQLGSQRQIDVVANNIANSNTTGFKAEEMVFKEYLVDDARNRQTSFTYDIATYRNTSQGTLQQTNNQLDFAINGSGYFAVTTPQGERYTKAGNFTINADGTLVTQDNHPVLNDAGAEIQFEETDVKIEAFADGRLLVDGEERDSIGIFLFENEQELEPLDSGLYVSDAEALPNEEGESRLVQGFIEKSNVQPVQQITNLIKLQRQYSGTAGLINNIYEIQEDAIRRMARQS